MSKVIPCLFTFLGIIITCGMAVAISPEVIEQCKFGASGDGCIFDIEAIGDGVLQVDTLPSTEGDRWRVTVVEVDQIQALSNVGLGSLTDFSGIVQRQVVLGKQYEVFVTYEGPLPGLFPTNVTIRFNGPVNVSAPRPRTPEDRILALDGTWSGHTSQAHPLSFTVVENAITSLTVGNQIIGDFCVVDFSAIETTFGVPQAITANQFLVRVIADRGKLSYTMAGTFTSDTSASGTFRFIFMQSFPDPPCSGSVDVSWVATKEVVEFPAILK